MDELLLQNSAQVQRICDKMKRLLVKKQQLQHQKSSEIIDGLYVGNYSNATNKNQIKDKAITLVVSCVKILDVDKVDGTQYFEILVKDKPQERISAYFDEVCTKIRNHLDKNQGKCLINCFSGKSRSVTFVLAYLILQKQMNPQTAYGLVKTKYPVAEPNSGFIAQIKQAYKNFKNQKRTPSPQKIQNIQTVQQKEPPIDLLQPEIRNEQEVIEKPEQKINTEVQVNLLEQNKTEENKNQQLNLLQESNSSPVLQNQTQSNIPNLLQNQIIIGQQKQQNKEQVNLLEGQIKKQQQSAQEVESLAKEQKQSNNLDLLNQTKQTKQEQKQDHQEKQQTKIETQNNDENIEVRNKKTQKNQRKI